MEFNQQIRKYKNVQKIFHILLMIFVSESVAFYECPSKYRIECDCGEISDGKNEMICPSPMNNLQRNHPISPFTYFQIVFKSRKFVDFHCYETLNGFNFPFEITSEVQDAKEFIIRDCFFQQTSNISQLVHLISTKVPEILSFQDYRSSEFSFLQNHFQGLANVKKLIISNNEKLTKLDENLLKHLPNLDEIHINGNKLKIIPKKIFNNVPKVTILTLADNLIESVNSENFANLSLLLDLILSNNQITEILPNSFDDLRTLVVLKLNDNKLKSLPDNIFTNLKILQDLNLADNELENLTETLFNELSNLTNLDISGNRFEVLPNYIFMELNRLKKLNLQRNKLTVISSSVLSYLVNLKEFEADYNKIVRIEADAFVKLKSLEIIKLSHNNLRELKQSADLHFGVISVFSESFALKELDLSFNNISVLYFDWISYSKPNFKLLNLSHNHIFELRDVQLNIFHADKFKIDLSYNRVKYISVRFLESYFLTEKRNHIYVDLSDNSIFCDCSVYNFLTYLDGSMATNVTNVLHLETRNLTCSSPTKYKGTLVTDIKSVDFRCPFDTLGLSRGNFFCPQECTAMLDISKKTTIVNCFMKKLFKAPEILCTPNDFDIELNLENNFLTEIPELHRPDYINVKKLFLAANNIETVNKGVLTSNLEVLELHDNAITRLSYDTINFLAKSFLKSITLQGNPWTCDCNARDFLHFVQNTELQLISDASSITCYNSKKPLKTITVNELCPLNIKSVICDYDKDNVTQIWDQVCPAKH